MANTSLTDEAAPRFPRDQLDQTYYEAVVRTPARVVDELRWEITAALTGAVYRHRNASEAAQTLLPLVTDRAAQSAPSWRYTTQTCLFEFVVALNSAFESSAYGLYFIGSVIAPQRFPLVGSGKWKGINVMATAQAYQAAWPGDPLAQALAALAADTGYGTLYDRRNILAHRIAPGFEHRVTLGAGSFPQAAEEGYELAWFGEPLAPMVTKTLAHCEALLTDVWVAAQTFATAHSGEFRQ